MIIKAILVGAVAVAGWWLVVGQRRGRQVAVTRMLTIALSLAAIVAVLAPDLVTGVAHMVGVGRGTDLVLYVLVVVFAFSAISLRIRMRKHEERLATLTRALALLEHDREHRVGG